MKVCFVPRNGSSRSECDFKKKIPVIHQSNGKETTFKKKASVKFNLWCFTSDFAPFQPRFLMQMQCGCFPCCDLRLPTTTEHKRHDHREHAAE